MTKLFEMKSVMVWFEPGVESGHINATITRMKELCSLGFKGSFNIIYLSNNKISGPPELIARIAQDEVIDISDSSKLDSGKVFSQGEYAEQQEKVTLSLEREFSGKINSFLLNDEDSFKILDVEDTLCFSGAADQTTEAPVVYGQKSLVRTQMDMAFGCEVMIQLQPARWIAGQSYIKRASSDEREVLKSLPHKIDNEIRDSFTLAPPLPDGPMKIGCYGLKNISSSIPLVPVLSSLSKDTKAPTIIHEIGTTTSPYGFIPRGLLSKKNLGEFYNEIDLMVCEGQNTANECLALGIPVLHFPKEYADNIYPSDEELKQMGFKPDTDQTVFSSVHAMHSLTQEFSKGSNINTLSTELKKIMQSVDRYSLFQLAERINNLPSPLESALKHAGIEFGVENTAVNATGAPAADGKNCTTVMREALQEEKKKGRGSDNVVTRSIVPGMD